jgi:uncharacterized membrane-anchored protein
VFFDGTAKLDKRTKNLVKRLRRDDIAIIDQEDLDRIMAEGLLKTKVQVVINASAFSTGRYPNIGPMLLISSGVHLIDCCGEGLFENILEGERVMVKDGDIYKDGKIVANGTVQTAMTLQLMMDKAKDGIANELDKFAQNTLSYMQKEKDFILEPQEIPKIKTKIEGRHVLIVVRGYDYEKDLRILNSYIRDLRPVLIGVDGGADALLKAGYKPHIIIGDMDSASDKVLKCGAELVVHAYPNGRAPGLKRLEDLNLECLIFKAAGTSEDIALIMAYELGAELLVMVGSHANMIEFLDKGRNGMASTFLTRLKVGDKLIDAKGVNKLYQRKAKPSHLMIIVASALIAFIVIIMSSPTVQYLVNLALLRLRIIGF